jgi:hypothetical protein
MDSIGCASEGLDYLRQYARSAMPPEANSDPPWYPLEQEVRWSFTARPREAGMVLWVFEQYVKARTKARSLIWPVNGLDLANEVSRIVEVYSPYESEATKHAIRSILRETQLYAVKVRRAMNRAEFAYVTFLHGSPLWAMPHASEYVQVTRGLAELEDLLLESDEQSIIADFFVYPLDDPIHDCAWHRSDTPGEDPDGETVVTSGFGYSKAALDAINPAELLRELGGFLSACYVAMEESGLGPSETGR